MNNRKYIKRHKPRRPAYHTPEYNQGLIDEAITIAYNTDTDTADLLDAVSVLSNPIL